MAVLESVSQLLADLSQLRTFFGFFALIFIAFLLGILLEARVGIEPTHKGFADLSLTTWVPRLNPTSIADLGNDCQCCPSAFLKQRCRVGQSGVAQCAP